mgnify:CR=1 FL=1
MNITPIKKNANTNKTIIKIGTTQRWSHMFEQLKAYL